MRNTSGLKRGNLVGVGRKRKVVRKVLVEGLEASAKLVKRILKMEQCIPVRGSDGNHLEKNGKPVFRYPTTKEWQWAIDYASKYALGTVSTEEIEHSGSIELQDGLSDDERAARVMAILNRGRARRADSTDNG